MSQSNAPALTVPVHYLGQVNSAIARQVPTSLVMATRCGARTFFGCRRSNHQLASAWHVENSPAGLYLVVSHNARMLREQCAHHRHRIDIGLVVRGRAYLH